MVTRHQRRPAYCKQILPFEQKGDIIDVRMSKVRENECEQLGPGRWPEGLGHDYNLSDRNPNIDNSDRL